jgi:hypothetical protein
MWCDRYSAKLDFWWIPVRSVTLLCVLGGGRGGGLLLFFSSHFRFTSFWSCSAIHTHVHTHSPVVSLNVNFAHMCVTLWNSLGNSLRLTTVSVCRGHSLLQ